MAGESMRTGSLCRPSDKKCGFHRFRSLSIGISSPDGTQSSSSSSLMSATREAGSRRHAAPFGSVEGALRSFAEPVPPATTQHLLTHGATPATRNTIDFERLGHEAVELSTS
jgi:hypothetical protein